MDMMEQGKDFEIVKEIMEYGGIEDDFEEDFAEEDDLSCELMLVRRGSLFKGA